MSENSEITSSPDNTINLPPHWKIVPPYEFDLKEWKRWTKVTDISSNHLSYVHDTTQDFSKVDLVFSNEGNIVSTRTIAGKDGNTALILEPGEVTNWYKIDKNKGYAEVWFGGDGTYGNFDLVRYDKNSIDLIAMKANVGTSVNDQERKSPYWINFDPNKLINQQDIMNSITRQKIIDGWDITSQGKSAIVKIPETNIKTQIRYETNEKDGIIAVEFTDMSTGIKKTMFVPTGIDMNKIAAIAYGPTTQLNEQGKKQYPWENIGSSLGTRLVYSQEMTPEKMKMLQRKMRGEISEETDE